MPSVDAGTPAHDAGTADAGAPDAHVGTTSTVELKCFSGSQTPHTFAKSCATQADCFVAQHWEGCCNVHAIGLQASEQSSFDAFEMACGGAPPCGCCCDRVTTEDGNVNGSATTTLVDCASGLCTTSAH
jgi:hypothetical protein